MKMGAKSERICRVDCVDYTHISRVSARKPPSSCTTALFSERMSQVASTLRRGATQSIGFALSDITNPVVTQIIHGAEEALRNAGYSLLVMDSERNPALDTEHIHFLHSRHVDGLIFLATSERRKATIDALAARDIPVVIIDRDLPKRL